MVINTQKIASDVIIFSKFMCVDLILLVEGVHLTVGSSYERDEEWTVMTAELASPYFVAKKLLEACGGAGDCADAEASLEFVLLQELLAVLASFAKSSCLCPSPP